MFILHAQKTRLQEEIERGQAQVARLEARLKDEAFLTKAPAAIVDKERQRLIENRTRLERLKEQVLKF